MNTPPSDLGYITWKNWDEGDFGNVSKKSDVAFAQEMQRSGIHLDDRSTVLEVGFGNGAFAGWVRRRTRHYVGTESNTELVSRARHAEIEAYPATLALDTIPRTRPFDLIAMFDVLEHMEKAEILRTLTSASRCLSPQGRILVRVPSGDSPFSGHLMHGDLTHKTHLGSYAFHQLAAVTGLEVISIRSAAYPIFGFGATASIRRLVVVPARKLLEMILRIIYYANEPVILAPTQVAVFRLKNGSAMDGR